MTRFCILCLSDDESLSYHKFPRDEQLRQKWLDACHIEEKKITINSRICSNHFQVEDYHPSSGISMRLFAKSVPAEWIWHHSPNSKMSHNNEDNLALNTNHVSNEIDLDVEETHSSNKNIVELSRENEEKINQVMKRSDLPINTTHDENIKQDSDLDEDMLFEKLLNTANFPQEYVICKDEFDENNIETKEILSDNEQSNRYEMCSVENIEPITSNCKHCEELEKAIENYRKMFLKVENLRKRSNEKLKKACRKIKRLKIHLKVN